MIDPDHTVFRTPHEKKNRRKNNNIFVVNDDVKINN
jgi:hypothetical protein